MSKGVYARIVILPEERFAEKFMVNHETGCWNWIGYIDPRGYGQFALSHRCTKAAHRYVYEAFVREIPKGLTIDHLCRNTKCVNPDHLEIVTNKENILRGFGLSAMNARKTHCNRGHKFTPKNTYIHPVSNRRRCKVCAHIAQSKYRAAELKRKAGETHD